MLCLPFFIFFLWRTTSIHHTYDYWILRTQPPHDSQIGWRRHELELYFIHNWGFGKSGRRYRRFVANEMSNKFKSLTRYQYIIWPYRERAVTSTHSHYRSLLGWWGFQVTTFASSTSTATGTWLYLLHLSVSSELVLLLLLLWYRLRISVSVSSWLLPLGAPHKTWRGL